LTYQHNYKIDSLQTILLENLTETLFKTQEPFSGTKERVTRFLLHLFIKPRLGLGEHFIFPLELELFCKITPAHLAEMPSQEAKFVCGSWERSFPEAKKFLDLFCEISWVLEFDELHGAAAQRQGRGEGLSTFF
jgi:hypothetical protein